MDVGDVVRVIPDEADRGIGGKVGEVIEPPYGRSPTNPNPNLPSFQWVRLYDKGGTWLLIERILEVVETPAPA